MINKAINKLEGFEAHFLGIKHKHKNIQTKSNYNETRWQRLPNKGRIHKQLRPTHTEKK